MYLIPNNLKEKVLVSQRYTIGLVEFGISCAVGVIAFFGFPYWGIIPDFFVWKLIVSIVCVFWSSWLLMMPVPHQPMMTHGRLLMNWLRTPIKIYRVSEPFDWLNWIQEQEGKVCESKAKTSMIV